MVRLQARGIYPAAFAAIKVRSRWFMEHSTRFRGGSSIEACDHICLNLNTESWSVAATIHIVRKEGRPFPKSSSTSPVAIHDTDRVADDVGGALLASGAPGIGFVLA
jgi:hypothetical protein